MNFFKTKAACAVFLLLSGAAVAQVSQEPVTVMKSVPTGACVIAPLVKVTNVGVYQCVGGAWTKVAPVASNGVSGASNLITQSDAVVVTSSGVVTDLGYPPALSTGTSDAPIGQTFSLSSLASSYNSWNAYGDSNTAGGFAAGVACNAGNTGTCYVDVTAQKINALGGHVVGNVNNYGEGGRALSSAQNILLNTWNEDVNSTRLGTLNIGTNDLPNGFSNFDVVTAVPYEVTWMAEYEAAITWATVPSSQKQAASAGTLTGFTADTTYSTMTGATSATNGSIVQLPTFTVPLGNEVPVLWYKTINSNGGTFSWQLVNATTSAIAQSGTAICAPANGNIIYSPSDGFTYALQDIVINPVAGFMLAGDQYYFKVTVTSATSASNVVTILGSGWSPSFLAASHASNTPRFWVFNVPYYYNQQFGGGVARLGSDLKSIVHPLQELGFPVNFYDNWNWVHGTFPEYGGATNGVHMSVLGSSEMATGLMTSTGVVPYAPYQIINSPLINSPTVLGAEIMGATQTDTSGGLFFSNPQVVIPGYTLGIAVSGEGIALQGKLGSAGNPSAAATFVAPGQGIPWSIQDDFWNTTTSAVQSSKWLEQDVSNTSTTVTPTQIVRRFQCSGTCIPYADTYTYPATSTLSYNILSTFILSAGVSATASVNNNSPTFQLLGTYWNGASFSDRWNMQTVFGTGTAPPSTLTFSHTGSTPANVSVPSLVVTAAAAGTTGVSYGGTTAAASNCNQAGTLTSVAGCIVVNIVGVVHYVPYF